MIFYKIKTESEGQYLSTNLQILSPGEEIVNFGL